MFDISKLCKFIRISEKDSTEYEKYLSDMKSLVDLIPSLDCCKRLNEDLDDVKMVYSRNFPKEHNIDHDDALANGQIKSNYFYSKRSVS